MIHDLLPTQERLFRLNMPNTRSDTCSLCTMNVTGDIVHSLLLCPFNNGAGYFLLNNLQHDNPNLQPQQLILLYFAIDDENKLPKTFLISAVLYEIWEHRKEKKPCHLSTIRASLEASILILRKSRHKEAAYKLASFLDN